MLVVLKDIEWTDSFGLSETASRAFPCLTGVAMDEATVRRTTDPFHTVEVFSHQHSKRCVQ